jgi:heme exporter protein C
VAIWNAIEDQAYAARVAALATLVGFVNIPIVKFSVEWRTLHQGASVFTLEGSKIAPEILLPLLAMACAFTCLYVALHLAAMRNQILRRRLRRLAIIAASEVPPRLPIASVEGGVRA